MARTRSVKFTRFCWAATVAIGAAAAATAGPEQNDQSYSIGFEAGRDLARSLKTDGVEIDRASLMAGLVDGLDGAAGRLSEAEMHRVLTELHRRVAEARARDRYKNDPVFRALADANEARAKAILDQRAAAAGARKLDGGVVARTLRPGDGEPAGPAATVVVTFHAALADGRQVAHGVETELDTAGLLPGARTLLASMRPGERVTAVIPPALAFGLAGREDDIGPNEAILAEVELLSVTK